MISIESNLKTYKNERIASLYDQIERQCISFERKMKRQLHAFHENVFHIALISTNKTLFNVKQKIINQRQTHLYPLRRTRSSGRHECRKFLRCS